MRLIVSAIAFAAGLAIVLQTNAIGQPPRDFKLVNQPKVVAVSTDSNDKKPLGVWVAEINTSGTKTKITVTIKADRLIITYGDKMTSGYFMLDCDYGITKDYVLFGIVNSVDGEPSERPIDKPFRFRFRLDDDALTIKDVALENCTGISSKIEGRYTLQKK